MPHQYIRCLAPRSTLSCLWVPQPPPTLLRYTRVDDDGVYVSVEDRAILSPREVSVVSSDSLSSARGAVSFGASGGCFGPNAGPRSDMWAMCGTSTGIDTVPNRAPAREHGSAKRPDADRGPHVVPATTLESQRLKNRRFKNRQMKNLPPPSLPALVGSASRRRSSRSWKAAASTATAASGSKASWSCSPTPT